MALALAASAGTTWGRGLTTAVIMYGTVSRANSAGSEQAAVSVTVTDC